jgi:hypothetical protein
MTFDPRIMETDENRTDYKQEKFRSLSIPTPLKLMGTKRGWNGEKRREVVYFQYTCLSRDEALEGSNTQRT